MVKMLMNKTNPSYQRFEHEYENKKTKQKNRLAVNMRTKNKEHIMIEVIFVGYCKIPILVEI